VVTWGMLSGEGQRIVLGKVIVLGEIARATKISKSQLSRIFNKKRQPSLDSVSKIAAYLGLSIDTLFAYFSEDTSVNSTNYDPVASANADSGGQTSSTPDFHGSGQGEVIEVRAG
jgi:transcriptional regulator with XRE-family HTH domain